MSLIRDALKSLLLAHALPIAGLLFAAIGVVYGGLRLYGHQREAHGFDRGYAVAHDSAVEATITRLAAQHARDTLRADSAVRVARDGTTALVPQRVRFDSAVAARHPLRLEPLPDSFRLVPSPDMVRVTVESTNEVYDIPAGAAREWFVADSLVAVAAKLLDKYVAANKGWSESWRLEHEARIGSDSLVALYAQRLRESQRAVEPSRGSGLAGRALRAVAWIGIGAVLHNNVHVRL
jgi:hypothetical protein